jgi:hypothetical protein
VGHRHAAEVGCASPQGESKKYGRRIVVDHQTIEVRRTTAVTEPPPRNIDFKKLAIGGFGSPLCSPWVSWIQAILIRAIVQGNQTAQTRLRWKAWTDRSLH